MILSSQVFHLDEFIPLFIFIFMVGALYGAIAPISGIFVAGFFLLAERVFRFMTLFVYGNRYQDGGFLFYTLSNILFCVLYMIIVILVGYLLAHGAEIAAIVLLLLVPVTYYIQRDVYHTFVKPSKTLSLVKARVADDSYDRRTPYEAKLQQFLEIKRELEEIYSKVGENKESDIAREKEKLFPGDMLTEEKEDGVDEPPEKRAVADGDDNASTVFDSEERRQAAERMQRRYVETGGDNVSDITGCERSDARADFFIYRQPSLNRATWESRPRQYREAVQRHDSEVWR